MRVELANKIILNPYITEKTFELVETEKKICFIVEKTASKLAIKDAINTLYEEMPYQLIPQEQFMVKKHL